MIVIPIQFIIALALGGLGVLLLIIVHIASTIHKIIVKKKHKSKQEQ